MAFFWFALALGIVCALVLVLIIVVALILSLVVAFLGAVSTIGGIGRAVQGIEGEDRVESIQTGISWAILGIIGIALAAGIANWAFTFWQ